MNRSPWVPIDYKRTSEYARTAPYEDQESRCSKGGECRRLVNLLPVAQRTNVLTNSTVPSRTGTAVHGVLCFSSIETLFFCSLFCDTGYISGTRANVRTSIIIIISIGDRCNAFIAGNRRVGKKTKQINRQVVESASAAVVMLAIRKKTRTAIIYCFWSVLLSHSLEPT